MSTETYKPLNAEELAEIADALETKDALRPPREIHFLIKRLLADLEAAERAILSVPEWGYAYRCVFCRSWPIGRSYKHKPGCAWVAAKERQDA